MSIKIVYDPKTKERHAHLHNKNDIFMARVQIPPEINHECHNTLYDYLKVNHGHLLNRIR